MICRVFSSSVSLKDAYRPLSSLPGSSDRTSALNVGFLTVALSVSLGSVASSLALDFTEAVWLGNSFHKLGVGRSIC
jgi:hypothetical protein